MFSRCVGVFLVSRMCSWCVGSLCDGEDEDGDAGGREVCDRKRGGCRGE